MKKITEPAAISHGSAHVRIKRAYEAAEPVDGYRVLVDRLWPRGVRKEALAADAWFKEIAPSDDLRRWFGHDPERWDEFAERYRDELRSPEAKAVIHDLAERAITGTVTLLYAAHDEAHNDAVVLRGLVERERKRLEAHRHAA